MAVAPLFVADLDKLQLELRLQGLRTGSEGMSIFTRATSAARVYLYQRLGLALTTSLVALTEVENPTTADEVRRKAASLVEVEIVRCDLLDIMPVMVADASGDAQQTYNDEGVWRSVSPEEREEAIARCRARIEELIELLLSEDDLGEDLTIRVWDGHRPKPNERYPGGTAHPSIGKFPGNFEEQYHAGNGEVEVRFELGSD